MAVFKVNAQVCDYNFAPKHSIKALLYLQKLKVDIIILS